MHDQGITLADVDAFLDRVVDLAGPDSASRPADAVADSLRSAGVGPGDPVLLAMGNSREFVSIALVLIAIGSVPVLLPPHAPASRTHRLACTVGAKFLIARSVPHQLRSSSRTVGETAQLVALDSVPTQDYEPGELIILTSGTSGIFTGCVHRVERLFGNARRHAASLGQVSGDRVLVTLPLHYSYAFVAQMLAAFATGGSMVIDGPPFTAARYRHTLAEQGITVSSLTPALVETVLSDEIPLPATLRCLGVGGAQMRPELVRETLRREPDLELFVTYGLTEAGPRVSTLAAHHAHPRHFGSVGRPLPGVDVSIDAPRSTNDTGELVVTTDTGLVRRVGDTRARGMRERDAEDGRTVIRTGDTFTIDDEGYLFFRGRRDKTIVVRGEKVDPQSVRSIAESMPDVRGASVWTAEDTSGATVLNLDIYCDDPRSLTSGTARSWLSAHLLRVEQPHLLAVHPTSMLGWRKTDNV